MHPVLPSKSQIIYRKYSVQGKANIGLKKQKYTTDFIFNSAHAPAEAA
jgi:hypothetical protein